MKISCAWMCVIGLLVIGASDALASLPGECLSDEEVELLNLVDQYRADNGLAKIPRSKSLSTVAQWHVVDAVANEDTVFEGACNLHSWSNMQPGLWSAMCYTPDHQQASKMWSKPREITANIYHSSGYEIAGWGYGSVSAVLQGWQNSPGHNNVILNRDIWANHPFHAMGVGVDLENRFYFIWFGEAADTQGEVPACNATVVGDDIFFDSSFE